MIHTTDEDTFQRITGFDSIPEDIQIEYAIWIGMYHRDGNQGPLGTLGCIALSRSLGHAPPALVEKLVKVDWREHSPDGTVRVEANFFGGWQPGRFYGFVDSGTLDIRLDNDENHRECSPNVVRLAAGPAFEPDPLDIGEEEDDLFIDLSGDEAEPEAPEAESGVILKQAVASGSE